MNRQSALAVWQQIPVANRTVEVNTKTGFSLTAGSYSVRASSTQYVTKAFASGGATSDTAAISSVTVTRAVVSWLNSSTDQAIREDTSAFWTTLASATTVSFTRSANAGNSTNSDGVSEFF